MDKKPDSPIVVEGLRPGTFTDGMGNTYNFAPSDLQAIAEGYDPAVFKAPVVIGHPKVNHPAWGWIDRAFVNDNGRLCLEYSAADPAFSEAVRKEHYKKVSLSLFQPRSPANPTPGRLAIRHLGYLGAAAPAITGLKNADFNGSDEGVIEFSLPERTPEAGLLHELMGWIKSRLPVSGNVVADDAAQSLPADTDTPPAAESTELPESPEPPATEFSTSEKEIFMTQQEIDALRKQNAELQAELKAQQEARREAQRKQAHRTHADFAATLTDRIPPAEHPRVVAVLDALAEIEQPLEFAAGNGTVKETPADALRAMLQALPVTVPAGEAAKDTADFAAPDTGDSRALAERAREVMAESASKGIIIDAATAVKMAGGKK